MKIGDFDGSGLAKYKPARAVIGLDIGSRAAKGVLLVGDEVFTSLIATGLYMQETADELLEKLVQSAGLSRKEVAFIVGTGYGRISLKYEDIPYRVVTEISCHAMGAHVLNPATKTIIDIGGQDSKAIKVDPATGKVIEFVMNDKCAAGTGRFLEKAAAVLGLDLSELGPVSLTAKEPAQVSSQCVVFAESEVISLRARGDKVGDEAVRANIAAGIHYSAARRVQNLLGRVGIEPDLVFSGGVANNVGMWKVLEELLGSKFSNPPKADMIFTGALGAAVYAAKYAKVKTHNKAPEGAVEYSHNDLAAVQKSIETAQQSFINEKNGHKKIGYLCAYTPLELLNAARVRHVRLFKGGNAATVSAGELFTQSVACDFSKSCIGSFQTGDPLHKSLDKVYNFHTCAAMKRASEVIDQFVPTQMYSLPKLRHEPDSRNFFREQLLVFRDDLEKLVDKKISDSDAREQIIQYNKIRRLLKKFSELRKRSTPVLTGQEYLDLVRGYYYLKPEDLLPAYEHLYRQLKDTPDPGNKPVRIMMSGSIVADGDRRLIEIIEKNGKASVVIEDHCTGVRPFIHTIRESGDPFQALAEGYLDQAPCARMKPLEDSVELSTTLAQEYDVEGAVYVSLKFCACYGIPQKQFIEGFQKLGIPVLALSGDYSQSDHGQLTTRVEAFLDVLQEKRSKHNEQFATA
jgi:predicted CoA-substrate-specific enzyme activase